MVLVRVSQKGYILISKKHRERYGVKPGGKVQLIEDAGRLVIKPVPDNPIETVCGF